MFMKLRLLLRQLLFKLAIVKQLGKLKMRSIVIDVSLLKKQSSTSLQQEVSFLYRKAIDSRSNENEGKRIADLAARVMAKANESEMNQKFDNVEELTLRDILEVLLEFDKIII